MIFNIFDDRYSFYGVFFIHLLIFFIFIKFPSDKFFDFIITDTFETYRKHSWGITCLEWPKESISSNKLSFY